MHTCMPVCDAHTNTHMHSKASSSQVKHATGIPVLVHWVAPLKLLRLVRKFSYYKSVMRNDGNFWGIAVQKRTFLYKAIVLLPTYHWYIYYSLYTTQYSILHG